MSTLPGLASKGEKGKAKFQSLDINNLYRVSRGESLEKAQQKSTLTFKHGMQSLGRVPSARRPPANLPSIKSEHSGTDAAVSLVPSGGPGWGQKQESSTPLTTTTLPTPTTPTSSSNVSSPTSTSAAALTPSAVAVAVPPLVASPILAPKHTSPAAPPIVGGAATDKSWSSVMAGSDPLHPPPYQSPQFQHEFPSLAGDGGGGSGGGGGAPRPGIDTQYGPGPSLRPQTEGSWTQGGSRTAVDGPPPRSNSAPLGGPPQLSAQVGLQQPLPPQFHGILPGFMLRGNQPPNGHGTNITNLPTPMLNVSRIRDGRPQQQQQQQSGQRSSVESDDVAARRPIIKEEDLNRMDDMTKDMGWAAQDEIDYNQKLAFSDEESSEKNIRNKMKLDKDEKQPDLDSQKVWNRPSINRRAPDEDELLAQKRRQQQQVIVNVSERAKQRKEEEVKLKLKREKEQEEVLSNPQTNSDEEKTKQAHDNDFRQLTSIEGRAFIRRDQQRGGPEARNGSNSNFKESEFNRNSRQPNLPPRLQKIHQKRNNPSPQPPMQISSYTPYDNRSSTHWSSHSNQNIKPKWEEIDKDDKEMRRRPPYSESNRRQSESRFDEYDYKKEKEDKWGEKKDNKDEIKFDSSSISRQNSEEWHSNERVPQFEKAPERFDRPQRPDSRDSRTSRDSKHSRDSESREHLGSWAENINYDEKRKEKEDRRTVPGPITKEKIEADEKISEKRNLTQLKKGSIPEKKIEIPIEENKCSWADDVATLPDLKPLQDKSEKLEANKEEVKLEMRKDDKEKDDKQRPMRPFLNRNRSGRGNWDSQSYNNKKSGRGSRSGRVSSKMGDFHATDSEESIEDNTQKSPKPIRKIEKDEKNKEKIIPERKIDNKKESYEPRGEPSRHGRGGSSNIRGRGGACVSKRFDTYGPPPKSPFGHFEDKDKKSTEESQETIFDAENKTPGVIGSSRKDPSLMRSEKKHEDKYDRGRDNRDRSRRDRDNNKKGKRTENGGDTSEHSDDSVNKSRRNKSPLRINRGLNQGMRRNAPPRLSNNEKRASFRTENPPPRQNSNGSLRSTAITKPEAFKSEVKDEKNETNSALIIADINIKETQEVIEIGDGEVEDKINQGDSDGFQEVKSKKNVKTTKIIEEKPFTKPISCTSKPEMKPIDRKPKPYNANQHPISQQHIANIPSLMDTPINPPSVIPQSNKAQYDRNRQKLPPRFAKQRENSRLQKMQQGMCDIELNKVNQNMNLYGIKDGPSNLATMSNAWEKPLGQLRGNIEAEIALPVLENCKVMDQPHSPAQNSSPNSEKIIGKTQIQPDKSVLDGSTPPVNTIIFENTNFKSTPGVRNRNNEKSRATTKIEETSPMDPPVISTFNKPVTDLLNKSEKQPDIQMQLFNKEDTSDMKLDFFDSEISQLTDDKASKNISLPRSMHTITSSNSTMSHSTADLNFKIASVKKVWDNTINTMSPVIEHSSVSQEETFSTSFGPDPNSLDPSSAFSKTQDAVEDPHEGYSPSPNPNTANNTTNVCKVKPTQQVPGTTGQNIVGGGHQTHSGIITMPPLSSPPIQPVIGPNIGLNQPPQQYTTNQHLGYQASLGGSTQFGMSAIPSPPNVLYNSTQQLQPNLYGGFPMDQMGGQRTSQFSQYPYGLGQNAASSHYSAQSLYLQTQPHPPQAAQAPPDLYQSLATNFRLQNTTPYGQNQQLNNPTTVLISSTSNSLMSASVKPSNQQISAIGTKTGAVGQTYQQQSQQGQQLYMTYDPSIQPNYLPNTGVMQRAPTGPVQNNVVQALQPSSSYYSGSTGGQTGYFQQPGSSTLQSGPLQQHQASYGLQGNVFGTHNQSHSSPNMTNISSHFLSQMQFAAAMNVQQFRNQNMQNASYLKGMGGAQQVGGDQTGRSQQLKSPGNQQDLSSVFNSGPQIPSPKSRQNCKQPPPQPSPTTQHKYNLYQGVGNQQSNQTQRYPTPIQRPQMNFQPNLNPVQNSGSANQKHRANNNSKGPQRNYYSSQSSLSSQSDKVDETKLGDQNVGGNTNQSVNSVGGSKTGGIGNVAKTSASEAAKEKEEASAIKD
ncbi:protein split ends isoform X1 [Onthophagus taurus]|uniref:protein split ends isoform X1 n=1 Tax=Onthophagus taurus TaxID=166361 RepID=UPI0039BDD58F